MNKAPTPESPGGDWQLQMKRDMLNVGLHSRVSTAYASGVSSSWGTAGTTIAAVSPLGFGGSKFATGYGHLLAWGSTFTAFRPLWPWAATELFGDYEGEKYGLRFGWGYKEHVPLKATPIGPHLWLQENQRRFSKENWHSPLMAKHRLRGVPVPTFGFGFESVPRSESRDSQVRSLPSKDGGSRSGRKMIGGPSAQTKQGGKSSSFPRGGTEGSRPRRRGSQTRERTASRTRSPKCPVHNVHHWCNVTRKMMKTRSR